jgi:tetratricopeptide (TPR) repeat protein
MEMARKQLEAGLSVIKSAVGLEHPQCVLGLTLLGHLNVSDFAPDAALERYEAALERYEAAIEVADATMRPNDSRRLRAHHGRLELWMALEDITNEHVRSALNALESDAQACPDPVVRTLFAHLDGTLWMNEGEYEAALVRFQEVVGLARNALLPTHPLQGLIQRDLGQCLFRP